MVFCSIGILSELANVRGSLDLRTFSLRYFWSGADGCHVCRRREREKDQDPIPAFFAACGALSESPVEKFCSASFTVEAALVLTVVLFTIGATIQNAYYLHDTVTGSMILEETLEKVRYGTGGDEEVKRLAEEGEALGSPRLWLGTYRLEISESEKCAEGSAAAGDWKQQMEIAEFQPETILRKYSALAKMGKKLNEKSD